MTRSVIAAASAVLVLAAAPATASAHNAVARIVGPSIAQVRVDRRDLTGFAIGEDGGVIAPADASAGTVAISKNDATTRVQPVFSEYGIGYVKVSGLALSPLRKATGESVPRSEATYLVAAIAGSSRADVIEVHPGTFRLGRTTTLLVAGTLPIRFRGAPLVNGRGELVGAVAGIGRRSWRLAPLAIVSHVESEGSGGFPRLVAVLVVLLVGLAGVLAFLLVRERRRESTEQQLQRVREQRMRDAARPASTPVVRRRSEDLPDGDDDFEIVIKESEGHESA